MRGKPAASLVSAIPLPCPAATPSPRPVPDPWLLVPICRIRDKGGYPEYASLSLEKFGLFDG